jgi:hypothetical protein
MVMRVAQEWVERSDTHQLQLAKMNPTGLTARLQPANNVVG